MIEREYMKIEELLKEVDYKLIDSENGIRIYKLWNEKHLYYMESRNNRFEMERDYFDFLDGHKYPYIFVLFDSSANKYYYLDMNKTHNWIKSCFETCDKEKIYMGKQVMNYIISEADLLCKLKKHK